MDELRAEVDRLSQQLEERQVQLTALAVQLTFVATATAKAIEQLDQLTLLLASLVGSGYEH